MPWSEDQGSERVHAQEEKGDAAEKDRGEQALQESLG